MMETTEITSLDDIKRLVDAFYAKVRADTLLGAIFHTVIQDRWPEHLEKMYRFWETVLLEQHTYSGSPFMPHARLPLTEIHFKRWVFLFQETIDTHFTGQKAEEAKWRAGKMAEMFMSKITYHKNNDSHPL